MEPSGIPVNAGHLANQAVIRPLLPHKLIQFFSQLPHGLVERFQIGFLMGFKPAPLIVEADAPHKIHSFLCKSGEHTSLRNA